MAYKAPLHPLSHLSPIPYLPLHFQRGVGIAFSPTSEAQRGSDFSEEAELEPDLLSHVSVSQLSSSTYRTMSCYIEQFSRVVLLLQEVETGA